MTAVRPTVAIIGALLVCAACARGRAIDWPEPGAGIVGLPVPEDRFVLLPATATIRRQFGCSGYDLDTGAVFTLDSAWVRRVDRAIIQSAESLFVSLRGLAAFSHLSPAETYVRQYLGVEREGRRMAYLHASDPALYSGLPGVSFPWESMRGHPISVCDGGYGVFGQFIDLETEGRSRLEFSDSYAGRVRYP